MQLVEGAKISQQILRQAINDPDFTFGIEAEFYINGAHAFIQDHMTKGLESNGEHFVKKIRDTSWHDVTHFFKPLGTEQDDQRDTDAIIQDRLEDFYRDNLGREKLGAPSKLWDALKQHLSVPMLMAALRIYPDGRVKDLPDNQEQVFRNIVYDGGVEEIKPFGKLGDVQYVTSTAGVDENGNVHHSLFHRATLAAFYELVADDLSTKLGTEVVSVVDDHKVFHVGAYKVWVVTSDMSLDGGAEEASENGVDMVGVEVVSNIMGAAEGLEMLDRMLSIMNEGILGLDVHTTQNTGLHINLGVKNKEIDPIKILVLSGDEYMVDKFDREQTEYSASIQAELKSRVADVAAGHVPRGKDSYDWFKGGVNTLMNRAREILANIETDQRDIDRVVAVLNDIKPEGKAHSINFEKLPSGYVEYRAIGNTDYEKRKSEIMDAVLHMIGITHIATEPSAYRKEFLKKLYLMIQRNDAASSRLIDEPLNASVGMVGGGTRGGYGVPIENEPKTPYDGEEFLTKYGFDSGSETQ